MKELTIYTSIHDMPTKNFFKCVNREFKYMLIAPDYNKLKETKRIYNRLEFEFEKIKEEWDIAMSDNSASELRMKYVTILKIRKTITTLEHFIRLLAMRPDDKEIIESLKKMRFNYNKANPFQSLKQLQGEVNNLKNLIQESLNEIKKDNKSDYTEYDLISDIETFKNGMPIDTERVVVAQFIAYIKEYKKFKSSQRKK